MKKIIPAITMICCVISFMGCGIGADKKEQEAGSSGENKIVIYTTFYPTYEFSRIIGGDYVEVINPLPEDVDPIFWMPPKKIIREYREKADLIVINGAGYEKWVHEVKLPEEKIVDTAKSFEKDFINYNSAKIHGRQEDDTHAHAGLDGHTWLDPNLAKMQAEAIKNALVKKDPAHKKEYENNFNGLYVKLNKLDSMFNKLSGKYVNQLLFASHPAYNYIGIGYGWRIKSFDFNPEQIPSRAHSEYFKEFVEQFKAKYIIWESYPTEKVEEYFIENFSIKSIEFSPIELLTEADIKAGKDYFSIMEQNIKNLEVLF